MSNTKRVEVTNGGNATFKKPKDMKKGETISGIYRGSYTDKYEKLNHRFEQPDGSTIILNGSGQVNGLLEKVETGTKVEVVYDGQATISKGQYAGAKAHNFKVFRIESGDGSSTAVAAADTKRSDFPF